MDELSHPLHQLFAHITWRKEKAKVITFSYLVKIIGTDLETIKTEGRYCFWSIFKIIGHFDQAAILDFGQRKMETNFFLNPHVSKI